MDLSYLPYIRRIVFTDDERALLLEAYPRWLSTFKKPSVSHLVGGDSGTARPMGDIDEVKHHSIHHILDKGLRDGTKAVVAMTDVVADGNLPEIAGENLPVFVQK